MITFDPDRLAARLAELETAMSEPGFWNDQESAQRISTEHSRISRRVELYNRLRGEYEDATGLLELGPEMADEIEGKTMTLRVNPEVAKELKSKDGTFIREIEGLTHKNLVIKSDPAIHQERFEIF